MSHNDRTYIMIVLTIRKDIAIMIVMTFTRETIVMTRHNDSS